MTCHLRWLTHGLFVSEINKYLVENARLDARGPGSSGQSGANLDDPVYRCGGPALRCGVACSRAAGQRPRHLETIGLRRQCDGSAAGSNSSGAELKPGTKVGKAEPIFPRLDKAVTLAKLEELAEADRNRDKPKETLKSVENEKTPETAGHLARVPKRHGCQPSAERPAAAASPSPQHPAPSPSPRAAESPKISIEDFAKVEMRTGEIKTAEPIPGAKKLLKLTVDIGTEVRQVCAGIAEFYAPEKLIGMKVVVVTNLQPRKLRGVESNGMIVAASIGDARPARAGHLRRRRAEWGEA